MRYLFLHGLGQSGTSWDEVLSALGVEGDCPELASFLRTDEAAYEALYWGFSDYCEGLDGPLALCGLSLGAVLALHYALDHPERVGALALIAPQHKMPKGLLHIQNILFRFMPEKAFEETGLGKRDMISLTNSMGELDFTPRLGETSCPTLILCGERDRANQKAARFLAKELPQAQLQLIPGAGHEVNLEAPAELAKRLREFWKNCSNKKGGSPV